MFVSADSLSTNGPSDWGAALLHRSDCPGVFHHPGDQPSVGVELLTEVLHAFEEALSLVECEFRLGERGVQGFFASEIKKEVSRVYSQAWKMSKG